MSRAGLSVGASGTDEKRPALEKFEIFRMDFENAKFE